MIYTAEFSGLGLIIALIWFLASTFLNKHKKSNKKVDAENPGSIFNFNKIKDLLENSIKESDLDISIDNTVNDEIENQDSYEAINNDVNDKDDLNQKNKNTVNISNKKKKHLKNNVNKSTFNVLNILKNKKELQKSIILKEILDKPKALRK